MAGSRSQPALDPLGIQLGSFLAHTSGDVEIGYESNLYDRPTNVVGDGYVKLRPALSLASDWGRHSVELTGRVELTRFFREKSQDSAQYWTHAGGIAELGDRLTVRPNIDYSREAQPRGSSTNSLTAGSPVFERILNANLGTYYSGEVFGAELLLAYRQERFEPVRLQGSDMSQQIRDTDGIGARASLLYRFAPSMSVLVEMVVDHTHNPHPQLTDLRHARGYGLQTGIRIDPTGLISGRITIGFRRRFFAGSSTPSRGFSYDVRLQWSPTELFTVNLKAEQQYKNSGILRSSAVLVNTQTVDLSYEMYRDLNLGLEAMRETSNYRDVNTRRRFGQIGLRAAYSARRWLQLSGFARYETGDTNQPLVATKFNGVNAGITAQFRL